MPEFDTVSEIILYVEEMGRMTEFYGEVLGLDLVAGAPAHGFVKYDTGECALCLHAGRDGDVGEYAPKVVFSVDDLDAAGAHLADHGVDLGEERTPAPGKRVRDGRDPEGNAFSIEATAAPE